MLFIQNGMNNDLNWMEGESGIFCPRLYYAWLLPGSLVLRSVSGWSFLGVIIAASGVLFTTQRVYFAIPLIFVGLYVVFVRRYVEFDKTNHTVVISHGVSRTSLIYHSVHRLEAGGPLLVHCVRVKSGRRRRTYWRVEFYNTKLRIHSFRDRDPALIMAERISNFTGIRYFVEEPPKSFWQWLFS